MHGRRNIKNEIWFTSDEHYFHKKISEYQGRPFSSVEKMNVTLISNHNAVVNPDDDVWHLGDFAFAKINQIEWLLHQLHGRHHFCRGNHDKELLKHIDYLIDKRLFVENDKDAEITVNGQFIVLHHYGKRVWNRSHHGSWQLFGHSHGSLPPYGKSVDVGVDSPWITGKAEYRPFSFTELQRYMNNRPKAFADGHKDSE